MAVPSADGTNPKKRDFAYWRDAAHGFLAIVCVGGALGHFIDWIGGHRRTDLEIALGFAIGFIILVLLSGQKLELLIVVFFAVAAIGMVNALVKPTLLGMPFIMASALLGYLLTRLLARKMRMNRDRPKT